MTKRLSSFRFEEEEIKKLAYLEEFCNRTRTELLSWAINSLYQLAEDIKQVASDKSDQVILFEAIRLTSFTSEINRINAEGFRDVVLKSIKSSQPERYEALLTKKGKELEKEILKESKETREEG